MTPQPPNGLHYFATGERVLTSLIDDANLLHKKRIKDTTRQSNGAPT